MAEIVGMFLAGWLWVLIGRTVAARSQQKVVVAGLVAVACVVGLSALSATYSPSPDRVPVYAIGHLASVAFWLWRFSVNLRRESTPAS